jgi:hypothetical protein
MTDQLTLLPEDTLASQNHIADNTMNKPPALMILVGSGRKLIGSWTQKGPVGLLERIVLTTSAWDWTKYYLTWKTLTTPQGRLLFQLRVLGPIIKDTECGLLPTPTASDGMAWKFVNRTDVQGSIHRAWKKGVFTDRIIYPFLWGGDTAIQAAEYSEMMMGYPKGWTDLNLSETP